MTTTPSNLERILSQSFALDHVVMVGRARSALVALIQVLRGSEGKEISVLIPENICPVLVTAIRAGGGRAVTVPVSSVTGLPDDQAFVRSMENCGGPGIVMPTHLYGFIGDYAKTTAYARAHGWFILENDTNVVRMNADHPPIGEALLLSFGYAKPIDVGTGGAILTNDPALAQDLRQCIAHYPLLDDKAKTQENETMLRRRAIRKNLDMGSVALAEICARETELSCFRFDEKIKETLLDRLGSFPVEKQKRLDRKTYWDEALQPLNEILHPATFEQPVPWRLIRRVPNHRNHFARALWENDMDAGINYRSLWREMPASYLSGERNPADIWGDQVLNLWVTDDYDKSRIETAAIILRKAADEL